MQISSDNIFQEFKLYIEGVQVPFTNISINQSMGGLPTALISIPPMAGLMDIARFYQPKVHIFFTERLVDLNKNTSTTTDKLMFSGLISGPSYSKTKEGNGGMSISFSCVHKYHLITECLIDYCGFINQNDLLGGKNQEYQTMANSKAAILNSLEGWTSVSAGPSQDYGDQNPLGPVVEGNSVTNVLPFYLAGFSNRLKGMPGVIINFWNQLQRSSFNPDLKKVQGSFRNMYKPLIETGLQFFMRMTGHMIIEKEVGDPSNMQAGCVGDSSKLIMVPPCNKLFFTSAIQHQLAIESLGSYLQNSNEITNLYDIFLTYYNTLDYDMLTLASPAEVLKNPETEGPTAETFAVDTIIKPSMPFYYSPTCNILFPSMYTSINVSYDEGGIPTRLDLLNNETIVNGSWGNLHYRTPPSIREAIALKVGGADKNLGSTFASSFGAIGKYEMGRGIKYRSFSLPSWLTFLSASQLTLDSKPDLPKPGSKDESYLDALREGWSVRFPHKENMNPWDVSSGVQSHQRLIVSSVDYQYSKAFASSKAGNVTCPFNPYIIPGYPMDILEASPDLPNFHGLCAAVSHNITSSSVSTQVSFVAAMTYSELASYYVPFINPYLQGVLGLAKNPTLVSTDTDGVASAKADQYYLPTLGVKSVAPEDVFDFVNGRAKSVKMNSGKLVSNDGISLLDHSFEADLQMCYRPIESKADCASRSGVSFIDLIPQNYTATGVKYENPSRKTADKFEVGCSQMLDYSDELYISINSGDNTK